MMKMKVNILLKKEFIYIDFFNKNIIFMNNFNYLISIIN